MSEQTSIYAESDTGSCECDFLLDLLARNDIAGAMDSALSRARLMNRVDKSELIMAFVIGINILVESD